jgi:hypothetical protein
MAINIIQYKYLNVDISSVVDTKLYFFSGTDPALTLISDPGPDCL